MSDSLTLDLAQLAVAGPPLDAVLYVGALGLIGIGAMGMVMSSHLFRIVLGLAIAEAGANLLLVLAGYRWDAVTPIFTESLAGQNMVDPVPQAMVLTAIVIGVGIQALALSILIRIRAAYGTLDMRALRELMARDIAHAAGSGLQGSQERPLGDRPTPAPGTNPLTMEGRRHD